MQLVKAMMIGDVVGGLGIKTLEAKLPDLIKEHKIDFVTVNGENAAEGFGMTETEFKRIIEAGADVITSGNHIWEKREFWAILESEQRMLRPANYPDKTGTPGTGYALIEKNNITWLVINLQGRELMSYIDCPFQCFDHLLNTYTGKTWDNHPLISANGNFDSPLSPVILVDFHAESSREKETLAYYADGRAALIAGTHTHVQTADERILPKGSAYITDLGMTGITDSVIGMSPEICLERFLKQIQYQMKTAVSDQEGQIHGVIAEIDADTGKAVSIQRI